MSRSSSEALSSQQLASIAAVSAGARAAGVVIALGYLLGLVGGPVVAVVGGLALISYGRSLLADRLTGIVTGAALAIVTGALGVAALRWGTLDLGDLRGVQSVLGPTLLVGPDRAALASGAAAVAALIAIAVWMSSFAAGLALRSRRGAVWLAEGLIATFAVVTVFFDPAQSALAGSSVAGVIATLGRWAGSVVVAGAFAAALALVLGRAGPRWRIAALAVAAAGVVAAAVVVVSII